jgi:hypothetical protein
MLLPYNMPYWLDAFIRFCLSVTGADALANPDDMPMLALLLSWAVGTLLIGTLIYLSIRVRRKKRGQVPRHFKKTQLLR